MSSNSTLLDSIYCLSQEASSTVENLLVNLHIQKTAESYKLFILLADLQKNTIEAYKASEVKYDELNLKNQLKGLFSKASALEEAYNLFIAKNKLPHEYTKARKLKEQLDCLRIEIERLSEAYSGMS